jgi:hypothetical protein
VAGALNSARVATARRTTPAANRGDLAHDAGPMGAATCAKGGGQIGRAIGRPHTQTRVTKDLAIANAPFSFRDDLRAKKAAIAIPGLPNVATIDQKPVNQIQKIANPKKIATRGKSATQILRSQPVMNARSS